MVSLRFESRESTMPSSEIKPDPKKQRNIIHRTKGRSDGPITRLVSPDDLGEYIKPFVFLDYFAAETNTPEKFGYHPHSGIATVTTIFSGGSTYEDSTDKSGILTAGGVEWMQAGGGVWHTGSAVPEAGPIIEGFQLWVALPPTLENEEPESQYIEATEIPQAGPARVIIGEYQGVSSPLPQVSPMTYLHVHLKDGEHWTFDAPAKHDVLWVAVNKGCVSVVGEELSSEIAVFDSTSVPLTVQAKGETDFVLGSALKHPYPLVTGYYSVHTTQNALDIGEAGYKKIGERLKSEGRI